MKNLTKWILSATLIASLAAFTGGTPTDAREIEPGDFNGRSVSFRSILDPSKVLAVEHSQRTEVFLTSFTNRDSQIWRLMYSGPFQSYMIYPYDIRGGFFAELPDQGEGIVGMITGLNGNEQWHLVLAGKYNNEQAYYLENRESGRVLSIADPNSSALFTSRLEEMESQKFFVRRETSTGPEQIHKNSPYLSY
ncbi:hypothetical protein A5816_001543 [Enterococcus sp. 3G1_DIV0629]|uniref:hypothetical protein n=1 Tax=Enterococcus sp. (strain 3G1_DIV0629) TaxID=1834176 RepID=UPI000A34B2A6|nr:hypothetical protein [Enterococcus sp. 3G1_DIV0629]EME7218853.1 hypothetical protein [Enterococcus faecium]EME8123391.1 hypothetical protein [Enterococcus faecium]OTO29258.1 hypothetical protein A5816_001543 [Enterococcus sp. 3G1_DIV0629]